MTGFTGFDTASFNDLRPSRIVRELIQNSLDAAVEADEKTAVVRFRVAKIGRSDVPDIEGYEDHFRVAVEEHKGNGELSDAAQQVVINIEDALDLLNKGKHYSLSILDNGIGLDEKRMTSLLGQGTSVKSTEASGSYGVGHLASIPTSALRYVLYGGVLESGQHTVSGCAVLASRSGKRRPYAYAAHGYLVKGFGNGKDGKIYNFISDSNIPKGIAADLREIKSEWGHGSTVVIPAFNYFGDDNDLSLWDIVSRVAAYNFNAAIYQGNLVVEVEEKHKRKKKHRIQRLNKLTLRDVLEQSKERVRADRKGSFFEGLRPSGQNAYSAYQAQLQGDQQLVRTKEGNVDVRLLTPSPIENTRVDLFRNGMWITDNIPGLKRINFTNRPPFHAVLTLNAREAKELHRLVRKAEGPMHDDLAFSRLSPQEKKKIKEAIGQIANKIRNEIPEIGAEEYTLDDYLCVETGGNGAGVGTEQFSMWGSPIVVQRPRISQRQFTPNGNKDEHEGDGEGKGNKGKKNSNKNNQRGSFPLPFRATVVPDGVGKHIILLECIESFYEVDLTLRIDENMDATCDRIWTDENVLIKSFKFDPGEKPVPSGKLEGDGSSIRIQELSAGIIYELVVEYELPADLANAVGTPVLRVDLHRLQSTSKRDA